MAKILDNLKNETLDNNQETTNQSPKSEKSLVNTIGQILPFAPLLFEQFTGQKISQPTGTIADMQNSISQLTLNLQQVIANQNQIFNKITSLETSANSQLISLDRRLQSLPLRLTHEREKKQIEYNTNSSETEEYN